MTNKGFLLFEVMVATVVLAIGITTALGAFNSAIAAVKKLQDYTTAMFLVEQKIFDIKTEGIDNTALIGRFGNGFERFSYKISRQQADGLPLEKVIVSITYGSGASTRTFTAATYLESVK